LRQANLRSLVDNVYYNIYQMIVQNSNRLPIWGICMRGLGGKSAIVTGGAGGIGREICRRLAAEGCAAVGIFDFNEKGGRETEALINADLARAPSSVHVVDITDYNAVAREVTAFKTKNGAIDILVNCAGWDRSSLFLDSKPDLWRQMIEMNLMGPLNVLHAVLPYMVERRTGKVINIASDAGRTGSSAEVVYSACKGGIIALTKSLCRELARYNIILNSVCPGPTKTPLLAAFAASSDKAPKLYEGMIKATPLRRIAEPTDIPGIVVFLASDDANFILGQTISVSGGLTMHG
jgi:2-hydroxycyclohexanecarboxyl-CoA dehydrogenase